LLLPYQKTFLSLKNRLRQKVLFAGILKVFRLLLFLFLKEGSRFALDKYIPNLQAFRRAAVRRALRS